MAVERNAGEVDIPVRPHIFWNHAGESFYDFGLALFFCLIEAVDLFCLLLEQAAGYIYEFDGVDSGLYFAQFNPVSHMLDLRVFSGGKNKKPLVVYITQISGSVDPIWEFGSQWTLDKLFFCFLWIIVITKSKAASFYAYLPDLSRHH